MTRPGRDRIVCLFSSDRCRTSRTVPARRTREDELIACCLPSRRSCSCSCQYFWCLPIAGGGLPQLAAARGEHRFLHARRRQLHLARARADRLQLRGRSSHRPPPCHDGRPEAPGRRRSDRPAGAGSVQVREFRGRQSQRALALVGVQPLALPDILLPIGISFFTFHAISYVVDVYRRDASAQKSPVHAALYLLLFPQLIAGPIIRYRRHRRPAGTARRRRSTTSPTACAASSSGSARRCSSPTSSPARPTRSSRCRRRS